jgi:hypothetical protein
MSDNEVIYALPREIPTNELIGRKFFRDLTKWFPAISLSDSTPHEEQYWGHYSVLVPRPVYTEGLSDSSISVSSYSEDNKHYITILFKPQDADSTDLPVKARTLLQNILTQLKVTND